ncbi:R3H domain-containing nucleic acid-binding protein [Brachybacterium vulturis]|uniref:R3H domain-containing nucleic acid-binding protein n=1 Tax=Brachybacterium vulturis TaxID=2017484 RepID=UPI00373667BC
MNVNDGTPASTAAEENSSQQPFEADAAEAAPMNGTTPAPGTVDGAAPATTAADGAPSVASLSAQTPAAAEGTVAVSDDPAQTASSTTTDDEDADSGETDEERLRRLEEEGDIAADYLEELLDITDLDGDMDIDVDGDRASVEIRGADRLARLNRPKGELLDALQELARLAVQTRTGQRSRLMLDIGGFRAEHKNSLEELAATTIAEAKESGAAVPMRAMNPFERKVVHDVAKREGLRSESDGDGKNRHVVIYPAS